MNSPCTTVCDCRHQPQCNITVPVSLTFERFLHYFRQTQYMYRMIVELPTYTAPSWTCSMWR